MQSCPNCNHQNPEDAAYCMNCGTKLTRACTNCGQPLPPAARFCMNCGQPVTLSTPVDVARHARLAAATPPALAQKMRAAPADSERKLVTILFADVVGSTALAEQMDPEEWTAIMNNAFERISPAVHRYEGTIARLLGDALLAFFGAPVAHEDDPVRAIRAALEMLSAAREYATAVRRAHGIDFAMRVGINTGRVIVGSVGSDLKYEYTAMGDAVNLAARMQSAAEPGTVLISDSTYRAAAPYFETADLGPITVKGKAEPVKVYRVLGERAGVRPGAERGITGLSSPLVGRADEMRALQETLAALREGRGGIVSVMGEAGLGKSRLMAEVRRSSNGAVRWLEGRAQSYETAVPYAPVIDMLNGCFGLGEQKDNAQRYGRIRSSIEVTAPGRGGDIAPFLASIMGIQPTGDDRNRVRYLEPPQMRLKVFAAVREWFTMLAAQAPLALVFEDLHWADPTSLDLIEQLMPLTAEIALVIVGLFRPRRNELAWRFHETAARDHADHYRALSLSPLDEAESRTLVANLLEIEDLPESVRALILSKAEGNPFFVEEVIRTLLDAGLVVREDNHWRATRDIVNVAVPDSLVGVITARVDRLDADARRTAQTASVIGRLFEYDVLVDISSPQSNGAGLDQALDQLATRELIRAKRELPARAWVFKHVLVQETVYGTLLHSRRRAMHRRVAECLERIAAERAEDIAYHFMEAREHARALPYLLAAGDRAAHAYAIPEANGYYSRGLECLHIVEEAQTARVSEAADDEEAPPAPTVGEINLPEMAMRAYEGRANTLFLANNFPGAVQAYQEMLQYGEAHDNTLMRISALNKMARALSYIGQLEESYQRLGESEQLAKAHDDRVGLAESYTVRCNVCMMVGDFDGAATYMQEATDLGRLMDVKEQIAYGLAHMSGTLVNMTRYDEAQNMMKDALAAADDSGNLQYRAEVLSFTAPLLHMRNGDLDRAVKDASEGLAVDRKIGHTIAETGAGLMLGIVARMRGEYEQAIAVLEAALASSRMSGVPFMEVYCLGLLGTVYLDISPTLEDQVNRFHDQALRLLATPVGAVGGGLTWADLGTCLLMKGKFDQAESIFMNGLNISTPHGLINRPNFLIGLAYLALARGDTAEAERRSSEARRYVDERRMMHFYADVAYCEGRVRLVRDEREQALERFTAAESVARQVGLRPRLWQAQAAAAHTLDLLARAEEAAAQRLAARTTAAETARLFQDAHLRALYEQHTAEGIAHPQL